MKLKYTDFDEAVAQYTAHTGEAPDAGEMFEMYHQYRNNWQQYGSFAEWLTYNK